MRERMQHRHHLIVIAMLLIAIVIMGMGMGGCRSSPSTPSGPMSKVVFTWTPGQCHDRFRLYEVTATDKRAVGESVAMTMTVVMYPRKSQWQVSGFCGDEEYMSEVTILQP